MFHFLRYKNLFSFNSIQATRIQSLQNPFRKCHNQTNPPFFLIQYLQSELGFSPERALTLFRKLKVKNPKNPDSVLAFFKSHGLSNPHIKSIIERAPSLLCYVSLESTLISRTQFFKEKGISESDLLDLMVSHPHLLTHSVEGHVKPVFDLLHSILGTDESVVQLLARSKLIFNPEMLSTNITILRNCGFQSHHISKLLRKHPKVLAVKSDRFNAAVEMVKGMGFKPQTSLFLSAILIIITLSRQKWDAKCKVFTSLGFSSEQVLLLFRRHPLCMVLSEENIRKRLDYFAKELGWGPRFILIHPTLLFLSLEKRIIPRHKFLQILSSKGLIKKEKATAKRFKMSEKKFLEDFIFTYESEFPDILKIYKGLIGQSC